MLLFIEIAAFIDTIIIHSTMSITQMLERQKFGEYETIVPLKRTIADLFSVYFWYFGRCDLKTFPPSIQYWDSNSQPLPHGIMSLLRNH